MKKTQNIQNMLAAIQRQTPTSKVVPASPVEVPKPPQNPATHRAPAKSVPARKGKVVQFWLHKEDQKIIRELAAWLAGQGIRPTDSMVVRAALRMARPGGDLLEAYRKAGLLDGRVKPSGKQSIV